VATRTKEKNRQYMQQYRAKNREKTLLKQREYQAAYHQRQKVELESLRKRVKELESKI